jgi:tetratricopeptide (TPR) repeat protein
MKLGALSALLALALAGTTSAAPLSVEQSSDLLRQSAQETDPVRAQDLARRALPGFLAALDEKQDCMLVTLTAEARIRAGDPSGALATIATGTRPECDPAALSSLAAWAHEYGEDGVRRGKGAQLALSMALHLKAAELQENRHGSADAMGAELASAGEIALQLGNAEVARKAGLAGLAARPKRDIAIRNGLNVLQAAAPEIGEGAATDLVAEAAGGSMDLLRDILDARQERIAAELKERPGDPQLLTAAGFYSFFLGGDIAPAVASRHLEKAAASGFPLVELAYLRGRAAAELGEPDKAKQLWKQQQRDFPQAAASRLAANDLAYLLATKGGSPAEMAEALASLDAHVAATPDEPALHETRALLLERMGRRGDALAAMQAAVALEPTDERRAAVQRLSAAR